MSKPKLPKVWVQLRHFRSVDRATTGPKPSPYSSWHSIHQYAPVQKPKVCVWRVQGGDLLSPHGRISLYLPLFCEDCGGKIRRAK